MFILIKMLNYLTNDYAIWIIFLAGMCGGVIADILNDNSIELPKKVEGKLFLGWIGGAVLGGFSGVLIDGSLITAFMGGFMGKEIITKLTSIEMRIVKNTGGELQLERAEVAAENENRNL